jgi:hypothetical protein
MPVDPGAGIKGHGPQGRLSRTCPQEERDWGARGMWPELGTWPPLPSLPSGSYDGLYDPLLLPLDCKFHVPGREFRDRERRGTADH